MEWKNKTKSHEHYRLWLPKNRLASRAPPGDLDRSRDLRSRLDDEKKTRSPPPPPDTHPPTTPIGSTWPIGSTDTRPSVRLCVQRPTTWFKTYSGHGAGRLQQWCILSWTAGENSMGVLHRVLSPPRARYIYYIKFIYIYIYIREQRR